MSQSRIGKLPIIIPSNVIVKHSQSTIEVSGKFGPQWPKIVANFRFHF